MLYLADSLGMMELAEVVVPEGDDFKPGSYNFGWPVAAMDGSTIIVSTQRKLIPGYTDDKSGKGQLLVISDDAGESWAKPGMTTSPLKARLADIRKLSCFLFGMIHPPVLTGIR